MVRGGLLEGLMLLSHRRLAILLGLGALVSCASLSGLTGGGSDAGDDRASDVDSGHHRGDANTGRDGGTHDATAEPNDARTSDAKTPDSHVVDAGFDAEFDAGLHWCATQPTHTFCVDFDEPGYLSQWNGTDLEDGGSLEQADAEVVSPPYALQADISIFDASHASSALLKKTFALTPATVHLAFELRVDEGCRTGFDVLGVAPSSEQVFVLLLAQSPVALTIEEAAPTDAGEQYVHVFPFVTVPTNTWNHISASITFGQNGAGSVTLALDDAGLQSAAFPLPMVLKDSGVTIRAGAANFGNAPFDSCGVHIDDLTVDLE
jgi:hypothetical protein